MVGKDEFPFSAAIFDMDGVIVDTEYLYMFEKRGFASEVIGIKLSEDELLQTVGGAHNEFLNCLTEWFERTGVRLTPAEAETRYANWVAKRGRDYSSLLNEGVVETLAALRERGVRIALASSSTLRNINEVLAACGLNGAFEVIVSGEQFRQSKPNPEIYQYALELLDLPAEACCCVEDSIPGIAAGKAAGLTVFAKREERFGFSQEAADVIIDSIPDLLAVVKRTG